MRVNEDITWVEDYAADVPSRADLEAEAPPCRCPPDSPCECPRVCRECMRLSQDVNEDDVCEPCMLEKEAEAEKVKEVLVVIPDDGSGMCVTCAEEPVPVRGQECSWCKAENAEGGA